MKGKLGKGFTLKIEEKKTEASKYLDPSTNKFTYD